MSCRILVVGHGLIGKQRARCVHALREGGDACALAGTVDPRPRDAALYGGAPHFARLEDVPAASFDAAVIAVPHSVAMASALGVAAQHKPFLIEKPLGLDLVQAQAIAAGVASAPRPSFVGYNYRFLPTIARIFAAVADGRLGKLRSIDMLLGHGGHPGSAEEWKLDPARAGGGVLIDPGVHLLDLALAFAPGVPLRHAAATRGFWKTGIEEDVALVLGNESVLTTLRVSHIRWINTFRVEIVGEDGYALAEGRGGTYGPMTLRVGRRWGWSDGSGRKQRETEETEDFGLDNASLDDELRAVVSIWNGVAASGAQPHPATIEEALQVATLCDAAYRALGANG